MDSIDRVNLSRIKKMVESLEKSLGDTIEDVEVSFEYVVGSLFPTVFTNVMDRLKQEHMNGYLEGYEAAKNESKGN